MTFKTLRSLASKPDLPPSIPPLLSVLHSYIGGLYTLQYSNTGLTTVDSRYPTLFLLIHMNPRTRPIQSKSYYLTGPIQMAEPFLL